MQAKVIAKYTLAILIVGGFFTLLYLLLVNSIPEANKEMLNITVGALISAFTGVVAFFYGSSQGSQDKTELLKK